MVNVNEQEIRQRERLVYCDSTCFHRIATYTIPIVGSALLYFEMY